MESQYWIQREGKTTGPFSDEQLAQMTTIGMVMVSDLVSADQINWRVAGQIEGLFRAEQPTEDDGTDSSEPLAPAGDDRIDTDTQMAALDYPPIAEPVADGPRATTVQLQPPFAVPENIPKELRRTYTCPHCSQPFEAVRTGAMGCPTTVPRYKMGLFTATERTKCPTCRTKMGFPMAKIRLCAYAVIFFGSLAYLLLDIARSSSIDLFSPIFVGFVGGFGFFAFIVIQDILMRQRSGLWFLGGVAIAVVTFVLAAPHVPEEWYISKDELALRRRIRDREKTMEEERNSKAPVNDSMSIKVNTRMWLGLPKLDPNRVVKHRERAIDRIKIPAVKPVESPYAEPELESPKKSETNREAVIYCKSAAVAYEERRYKDAIVACKKAIAIKPDYVEAYGNMGAAYGEMGQHTDAINACKKAIAINPDYAVAYFNMGNTYLKLGQHTHAIVAYKKAINLKPDLTGAYLNMGAAYAGLGRYNDEIATYKKTIAISPNNATAYCNMGSTYLILRKYTDAIAAYKKAVAFKPDYAKAYFNMGVAHSRLGRYAAAIVAYKKAISIEPNAGVYFNMGNAYAELKQYPNALAAFKKSIALEPTGQMADTARKLIRWLREQ
jgi:tetratricopeptide (TPR) repeat protein